MTEAELKAANNDLMKRYDEAVDALTKESELNNKLIKINKTMTDQNIELMKAYQKAEGENKKFKTVFKKGIFFEYDNDPSTMIFVPVLADLKDIKLSANKPTRLMYTFKFQDMETWVKDVHAIMGQEDQNIHRVNEEDI